MRISFRKLVQEKDAMWQVKFVDPKWNVIPKRSLQSTNDWLQVTDEHSERLTELANALERLEEGNPWNQRISICEHGMRDTEHGVVDADTTSRTMLLRPLLHPLQKNILACPIRTLVVQPYVTATHAERMAVRLEAMSGEAVAQKDKIVAKTWLDAMQALLPQLKKKFTGPTLLKMQLVKQGRLLEWSDEIEIDEHIEPIQSTKKRKASE